MKWFLNLIGLPSPYMILAVIAVGTGLFFFGRYEGGHAQRLEDSADALKTVQLQLTTYQFQVAALNDTSAKLEKNLESLNVSYAAETKVVTKFIDRPVYKLECIDNDGLSSINRILAARSNPSGSEGKMSITIPARRTDGP